jgi:hypothetical protein
MKCAKYVPLEGFLMPGILALHSGQSQRRKSQGGNFILLLN